MLDSKTASDRAWIAGLLIVAAVAVFLRFDGLAEPSLWLDEILQLDRAQRAAAEAAEGPWHAWLTGLSVDRENGPLYYATQLLALRFFEVELAVRLVPALAGVAAVIVLCFAAAAAAGSRWAGLASGLLLAVSPLHVYYSREGRPYAAVMLAAALLLLLGLRDRRWGRLAAWPVCVAAAYLGAVSAPLLLSCLGLAALSWWLFRRRGAGARRGHLALAAGLALGLLPLLFPTVPGIDTVSGEAVEKVEHGGDIFILRPLSPRALDRLAASLTVSGHDSGTTTWVSWLALALALWGGVALLRRDPPAALWVVGLWVLPIAGWLALLEVFDHWYNVRYTSSGLPAFVILVAVGLVDLGGRAGAWSQRRRERRRGTPLATLPFGIQPPGSQAASLLVALPLLAALLMPAWRAVRTEPWQKPPWRELADLLGTLASQDEAIVARDPWSHTCLGHYLRRQGHRVELFAADLSEERARAVLDRHAGGFVVAAGYRRAPWLRGWLGSLHPLLRRRQANLRVWYHPDFATLYSAPGRGEGAAAILARLGYRVAAQEFTRDPLLLGAGWSSAEVDPEGRTFRWAAAERAEIAVFAPESDAPPETDASGRSRRRRLRLRAMPFPSPDLPPQQIRVSVNGEPLAEVDLEPGWNERTLPAYESERAIDYVTFDFAWLQSPREIDPDSPDGRRLAMAFDRVEAVAAELSPDVSERP